MKLLEHVVSEYNDIHVIQTSDGAIDFDVIGATHATWHPSLLLTGHAWDAVTAGALMHSTSPRSMLLLGLGGGTIPRQLRLFLPHLHITALEIDPEMVRLARTHMELDRLNLHVLIQDAYAFLENDTASYDIIIDDLYRCGDHDVERPRPITPETLADFRARLRPNGVIVTNLVLGRGHRRIHKNARHAFFATFPEVRALRPPLSHNEALVGADLLRSPRSLRALGASLSHPHDQKRWKELRNLQLRSLL